MGRVLPIVFALLWALCGVAQYGPGTGEYGALSLQFSGQLVSAGSCVQEAPNLIRCRVPAGTRGTIQLTATVTPSAYSVSIAGISLPAWAHFLPASGYGTAQTTCTFISPSGAAGSTFELRFQASAAGLVAYLTVILEVVGKRGEVGSGIVTVPTYTTDSQGRFHVPATEIPNTWITGTLKRCGGGLLPNAPIAVRLIPVEGKTSIRSLSDIGAVEVSSPQLGTTRIPRERLRFLSSMDVTGRVQRTVDVGEVCLSSQAFPAFPTSMTGVPLQGPATGTTDSRGRFEVSMPGKAGEKVWGTLVDCSTGRPLRNRRFKLEPVYEGERLRGFRLTSDAFAPETVERFVRIDFSFFGKKGYSLGKIRVSTKTKEDLEHELEPIREGDLPEALRDLKDLDDPGRAVLLLGKYLRDKCFRVEVSRGKLEMETDGEQTETEWYLLVVYIGNKAYFVESTHALPGTPRIVGVVEEAKGGKVFVEWDVPFQGESRAKGYRETERLSLEELEEELKK